MCSKEWEVELIELGITSAGERDAIRRSVLMVAQGGKFGRVMRTKF